MERAALSNPHDAKAQARYGTAMVGAGEVHAGIAHLRRAVAINPGLTAAWHNIGLTSQRLGWVDVAADAYEHVVATEPNHGREWIKLGYIDMQLGRYREAERAFHCAARLEPAASEPLVGIASLHYADFHFDAAIADLKQAIVVNPSSAAAYANMAAIYIELGQFANAEGAIRTAISMDPASSRNHLTLARILASSPVSLKQEEAQRELDYVLGSGRGVGRPIPARAEREKDIGEEKHIEEEKDTAEEEAEAEYYLGDLARRSGKRAEALTHFRRSNALAPQRPDAMLALGHALVARAGSDAFEGARLLRQYKQAKDLQQDEVRLRQMVEEHPSDSGIRLRYGKLLSIQGNTGRAVWELRQALRLNQRDRVVRRALSEALRIQGREEEADAIH